jgi:outer membrane protein insertion porin family
MLKFILKINFLLLIFLGSSFAEIVNSIDITGNKRLSKDSIILFGKIELKKDYTNQELNIILKNLYDTNFFKQINLNVENNILKISILENPIVEDVTLNGIKNKTFKEALVNLLTLTNRKSYIESEHLKDTNRIKNFVKASGYYFAEVKVSQINNNEQNSVQLIYDIDLGDRAKIKDIVFIGDKKIKDKKLKNIIASEENKFWKFISNKIYLDAERINLDKRLLSNYYKNNGYYSVEIENSFVEFQDKNSFKLVFKIKAGEKYKFNNVNLILPDDFEEKYFIKINEYLSKLKDKDYSLNRINKILDEIDNIALFRKYEFINADLNETVLNDYKLDISINIRESEKFYVEKINVLGNQFTLEEVIRNNFLVDEGDPYNELIFNKTINTLKSTGFFKTVDSNVKTGSTDNLKILDITVEEKPTGEISLGAGVGTSGATMSFGVKENNFLGKGIALDTNLSISESTVKGQFIYSKPNFNYSDNTLFTSVSSTNTDHMTVYGYKTSQIGASVGTRFQQYENLYFSPSLAANFETLKTTDSASVALKKQKGDYNDLNFNYSLDYDLRNQRYQTSDGFRNVFYQELPVISESYEITNQFQTSFYKKIIPSSDMIGRASLYTKAVNTLSNKDVRISKRLYIPQSKLRGFESGKVGPRDGTGFVGGNYITTLNLSSTLPQILPSFQNLDVSFFIDAANIWGVDYDSSLNESNKIRSSTGVAMDILTPIGPLNFSLSQPITKSSSDVTETFRFNLGTTF